MFEPQRSLLNPKFEGYKFHALDQTKAISTFPLHHPITQTTNSGRTPLSFEEVHSRIRHNHLSIGPDGRSVYIDADLKVVVVNVDETNLVPSFDILYELPRPIQTTPDDAVHREYPSAIFVNQNTLLVSDGYGTLYALDVPSSGSGSARLINSFELVIPESYGSSRKTVPFRLHDVHLQPLTTDLCVSLIISSKHYPVTPVSTTSNYKKASTSLSKGSKIEFDVWGVKVDLGLISQDQTLPLPISWHRRGQNVPSYIAYDDSRNAFFLAGSSKYRPLNTPTTPSYEPSPDEIAPIPRAGENLDGASALLSASISNPSNLPTKPPPYSWTQTSDSVTIAFPLPSTTPKSAIKVAFSPKTLTVLVSPKDGEDARVLLPRYTLKPLWDGILSATSLWTWDRDAEHSFGVLTLHLDKQHEGTRWSHVFASSGTKPSSTSTSTSPSLSDDKSNSQDDDVEVPETLDPSELYLIRESLEKYTAALRKGEDSSGMGLGHGVPSLGEGEIDDEIDSEVGDGVLLTWVNADGSVPSWSNALGMDSPVELLSTPLPADSGPPGSSSERSSLVIKHGVDGVLFSLDASTSSGSTDDANPPLWKHTSTFSALSFVLASKRDRRFVYHVGSRAVFAFESGARGLGGNVYIYRNTVKVHDLWAQQAVLKVGSGGGGSLLGVGILRMKDKAIIACLCEGEWVMMSNVL